MLSSLGLRIERLFYLGFILIIFSFIEVYLTSAAAYFEKSIESAAAYYLNRVEIDQTDLLEAYERDKSGEKTDQIAERAKSIANTRHLLGLAPVPQEDPKAAANKKYQHQLQNIFESYGRKNSENIKRFSEILNASKRPDEILVQLRAIRADELTTKGLVWGIETPRLFSMQYGNVDYRIPASFLSVAFFSALCPVILAWLGSFYNTRKRELLLIRDISDFRQSFPHILNSFPVTFTNLARSLGIHQTRRSIYFERVVGKYFTAIIRSILVLLFITPMMFCTSYSLINICSLGSKSDFFVYFPGIAILAVIFIISFQIVAQEIILLMKKEFYA